MNDSLISEIDNTMSDLTSTLDLFNNETFNTVPFEGSWTAGQVAEHTLMSAAGVSEAVRGKTEPSQRQPDEHVAMLRSLFLNFDIKMKSPNFILPSDAPKDQTELKEKLVQAFSTLREVAKSADLTAMCLDFEMPTLGFMTRLELINFAIVHTQRHIWQLKNIHTRLEKSDIASV